MPSDEADDLPSLADSKTLENVKAAFAADAQDVARYRYFATRAEIEGDVHLANLFRSASRAQATRAEAHLDILREVGDPKTRAPLGTSEQNLKAAIARAEYEATTMYVNFARVAREEGFDDVGSFFETLARAEKRHLRLFQKALEETAGVTAREPSAKADE